MWTGGKPPSLPAAGASPQQTKRVSPSKMQQQPRHPSGVKAELEALRQRGLATLLNKHFTETTKKLAAEKAAADAALRDLERRKAGTSDFKASGDGELSPLDSLYLSVNQWRNECRKKERETLLLYQRYVDKFGSTGQVQVPMTPQQAGGGGRPGHQHHRGTPPNFPPRSPFSTPGARCPSSNGSSPAGAPPPPSSEKVPNMAADIEAALEEYLRKGAISLPSVEVLGKDETFQGAFSKEDAEFRNFYRRQLELRGIDAKATRIDEGDDDVQVSDGGGDAFLRTIGEVVVTSSDEDDDEDEDELADGLGPLIVHDADDVSVMSCITFNSHITRELIDDCERTVVTFLQEEQEAIRKIIDEEGDIMSAAESAPSQVGSESMQAAEQAETMVKQMQSILDNFKNSETEACGASTTAGGSSDDTATVAKEARPYETSNPDEKWMVYYDDYYQREYYHELNSNRTQWEPPEADATSVTSHSSHQQQQLLSSADVVPEARASPRRESRISQYRRKQRRRRRKRRILAAAVLGAAMTLGAGLYLWKTPRQDLPSFVLVAMPYVDVLTGKEAERKQKEEQELLKQQQLEAKRRQAAKEAAERKAKEEAEWLRRKQIEEAELEKAKQVAPADHLDENETKAVGVPVASLSSLFERVGGTVSLAYVVDDLPLLLQLGNSY